MTAPDGRPRTARQPPPYRRSAGRPARALPPRAAARSPRARPGGAVGRPQGLGGGESDPCGANINIPIILSYYNSFPSLAGPPASRTRPPWPAGHTWPIYELAAPDNGLRAPGPARQNRAWSKRRLGYSAMVTMQCTQPMGLPKHPCNVSRPMNLRAPRAAQPVPQRARGFETHSIAVSHC